MQNSTAMVFIKKYAWLIGLIVTALVVLGVIQLINQREFRVSGTNPSLRNVSVASPFLKINFNRSLSSEKLDVSASANIIDEFRVSGKTLHITINRLEAGKAYVITVRHIQDEQGNALKDKTFSFTTTTNEKLSEDQQKALTELQDRRSSVQVDPLLAHLPYNTLRYRMSPVFVTNPDGQQALVIEVQIILPPGIGGTAQEGPTTEQYKQEVLNYIRSFDLDPANYTITYQVINVDLDSTRGGEL